jgi:hypothetical protein
MINAAERERGKTYASEIRVVRDDDRVVVWEWKRPGWA